MSLSWIQGWELDGQLHAFCHTPVGNALSAFRPLLWEQRLSPVSVRMMWLPDSLNAPLQVMKLTVQHRRKALTFVSSVGVASPLGITDTIQEDTLGADLATEFPASGGYAYGYRFPVMHNTVVRSACLNSLSSP